MQLPSGPIPFDEEPSDVPADTRDPGDPAKWMVLSLLLAIGIFELWALATGHNTISHWFQRLSRAHPWFKWFFGVGMIVMVWHLIEGF